MNQLTTLIDSVLPPVAELRRHLHANPELSRAEHDTSRKVRALLEGLPGIEVLPPLMDTDVVALLDGGRGGPCLALRADLDALPIDEETDVAYKSTVPGVMHACGHDGHTAILVGTAMVLSAVRDTLPGRVKFIFQPDEEQGGGGGVLCERGVLEAPKVDAAIALHGWPSTPVGTISIRPGPVMAANTAFHVTVRGRGAHAAYPYRGVDPIVIAAHIITALQSIVSRTVDPLDAAVVTVGHVSAGSATNVIPPECFMKGTLRYLRDEVGEHLRNQVWAIAENTARAHGGEAAVAFESGYPPMTNDAYLAGLIEGVTRDLLGPDQLVTDEPTSMGVEDFAFYAQRVPAAEFRLGLRPKDMEAYPSLHNPRFDFNDEATPTGIRMFCEITRRFLSRSPEESRRSGCG